jgi:competence protein ComEA
MNLKKYGKDWFTLSSRERTGILVLLGLIVLTLVLNLFLRYYPFPKEITNYAGYCRELELFRNSLRSSAIVSEDKTEEQDAEPLKRFPFDPNTATKHEMVRNGMDERIAARILSFRKKGGRFHEKEDLLKIYGFDRILYTSLAPYITVADKAVPDRNFYSPSDRYVPEHPVEINSSDTSALKVLRGIGPVLASRIVKYRILLGGYSSVDQLREVYGISDSLFQAIRDKVTVDTALISRISINEAGEEQLSRHPYISRYTARAIVSYRKAAGYILSADELVRNKIIRQEQEARIKVYLSFDTHDKDK